MKKLTTEGKFNVTASKPDDGWIGAAGAAETPFIRILFTTDEMEQIEWTGWLSQTAMPRTIETLTKVFGFNGDLIGLEDQTIDPFSGKKARITTEFEEYKGKTTLKVRWLNPVGATVNKQALKKSLSELQREAKLIARESMPVDEKKAPTQTRKADPDLDGENIPF